MKIDTAYYNRRRDLDWRSLFIIQQIVGIRIIRIHHLSAVFALDQIQERRLEHDGDAVLAERPQQIGAGWKAGHGVISIFIRRAGSHPESG